MWITLAFLFISTNNINCHIAFNTSDVIVVGRHADLTKDVYNKVAVNTPKIEEVITEKKIVETTVMENQDEHLNERDDVIFVTTESDNHYIRDDKIEDLHGDTLRIGDLLDNKARVTVSPESDGVVFVSGKNEDKTVKEEEQKRNEDDQPLLGLVMPKSISKKTKATSKPLDCEHLDCENKVESLCGAKRESGDWRYRLFLNECYFRKVNCGFSYDYNRFIKVDLSKCKNLGTHAAQPYQDTYKYNPPIVLHSESTIANDNRRMGGRRAMSLDFIGAFCGHDCPIICTDDYKPECAISSTGVRQVFTNHCKLDMHSCQFGVMWKKRPLAECVGGKKADLQQNRAFINWMQRVGIVDKRGKLVLN